MRRKHKSSTCEVLVNGQWHECPMSQVDAGDVFRIRKPDGKLHRDAAEASCWRCVEVPAILCEAVDVDTTEGDYVVSPRPDSSSLIRVAVGVPRRQIDQLSDKEFARLEDVDISYGGSE